MVLFFICIPCQNLDIVLFPFCIDDFACAEKDGESGVGKSALLFRSDVKANESKGVDGVGSGAGSAAGGPDGENPTDGDSAGTDKHAEMKKCVQVF